MSDIKKESLLQKNKVCVRAETAHHRLHVQSKPKQYNYLNFKVYFLVPPGNNNIFIIPLNICIIHLLKKKIETQFILYYGRFETKI